MMEWSMEGATTFEELADLEMRLLQDGLRPNAEPVERLLHLWRLCLRTEGSMNAARLEVKALQEAHDRENMEVQKKLDQVRVLIAKQNSFNVKLEEENQQLHAQLKQLHLDKEAEKMEVAELLDQGGLCEIILSSPSEQVAYLLVERASLLERLQALDVEKSPSLMAADPAAVFKDGMDKLSFHKAVPSRGQSSWKKLLGLRKAAQSKQKLAVVCSSQQHHCSHYAWGLKGERRQDVEPSSEMSVILTQLN
ncbi:uncharacterized protein LOC143104469 [Alosa pseudoharengus]|uniref:uncharacterized protein LOC143104469 n=1 Tax=Alosa pseudoharengus TaxID=34774 RepID=UPI003F8B50E8